MKCQPRKGGFGDCGPWQLPAACDPIFNGYGCYFEQRCEGHVEDLIEGPYAAVITQTRVDEWAAQIGDAVVELHEQDSEPLHPDQCFSGLVDLMDRVEHLRGPMCL